MASTHRHTAVTLAGLLWLTAAVPAAAQINFGDYIPEDDPMGHYSLVLTPLSGNDELDFGFLISGDGLVEIDINSEDVVIVEIEGVRYLDVFVTLDAPPYLTLGGLPTTEENERMEFTLQGAYANQGSGNTTPAFRQLFTGTSARFPIFRRTGGPPGPPPTPPHSGYVPPRESAYLFLGGSIEVGESQDAGFYSAEIIIEVSYDI
ncbi:hypothetical protein QA596_01020 [Balneolales bacterium ANBcel1]|nr:hypothetical protein [Balneolales bacterium ANBcel1]